MRHWAIVERGRSYDFRQLGVAGGCLAHAVGYEGGTMGFFSRIRALSNVNAANLARVRQAVEGSFQMCEAVDMHIPDLQLRETYYRDLLSFCLFIASSDGHVSGEEVEVINMALGSKVSKRGAERIVRNTGAHNWEEYSRQVPPSFVLLSGFLNAFDDPGFDPMALVNLYAMLGAFIAGADGILRGGEIDTWRDYVQMLYDYVKGFDRGMTQAFDG